MLHEDTARHGEPVFSREEKSDDIVARLAKSACVGCYECVCGMCAVLAEAVDEIKQLRAAIEACNDDFFSLKDMYDRLRESRDQWQELAESLEKTN
jgi:hypothetical protein